MSTILITHSILKTTCYKRYKYSTKTTNRFKDNMWVQRCV